nr:MAG TPA: hypothetical protein [Caudoviricetes sp.]
MRTLLNGECYRSLNMNFLIVVLQVLQYLKGL